MYIKNIRCPKVGKGTEEDPIRPDVDSVMPILKEIRETVFKSEKYKDKTFFIVQVVKDLGDEFEVEVKADKSPEEIAKELGIEVIK